ncbi:TPA: conjugal transfer protein TrbL family protein [Staphylococcus aureus]
MDWIKDAIKELTNGIAEGMMNFIFQFLYTLFYEPLKFFIWLLDKILIDPNSIASNYISNASVLVNSLITSIAICVFAFKMIQVIKQNAEGNAESPGYYVAQLLPSSLLVALLPWVVDIMTQLSYTATRAFLNTGQKSYLQTIKEWSSLKKGQEGFKEMLGSMGTVAGSQIMFILFIFLILVFTVIFIFQFVNRIADLVIMKVVAPLIAVSMLADENNYLGIWWRELLAISIQLPLQVFTFFGGINLFFGAKLDVGTLLLGIGFFILTVKSPSFIRSMVYSTGSGRMATGMAGSGAKLLVRKMLYK